MKSVAFICAAACALLANSPAFATDINTTGSTTETVSAFGYPDTATYGQTFTAGAGDNFLNAFSMYLNGTSGALTFRGYLATWDGAKAGTLLYTSANRVLSSTAANQEYFFAPLVAVTPGTQYVAFLSVSQIGVQNAVATSMPYSSSSVLAGGNFVYMNNGTNFDSLFASAWTSRSNADVALKVDFSAGAPAVPEPATWGMMILGMGLAGAALRRSRRRSTSAGGNRLAAGIA